MVNINKYIKALLHPAGGHQGSHKTHQAGNRNRGSSMLVNSLHSGENNM